MNNTTELVFILDRSGSMSGLEGDTVGGFNSMIAKQRGEEGVCYVSTVLFNAESEVIHDRVKLQDVPKLTEKEYFPHGCTALLDAVGEAVKHIANIHKYARSEDVPAHTLFCITTDGMENASKKWTHRKVKELIEKQKEKYGWEFLFMGADIDSAQVAESIGISEERSASFTHNGRGSSSVFEAVGCVMEECRSSSPISGKWKSKLK
ncbi:MAG: VWA domain-containing protein [Ruminiclostridium sp.]|nr:VWA domain-containing protein [Ruminiclostridium sp.]